MNHSFEQLQQRPPRPEHFDFHQPIFPSVPSVCDRLHDFHQPYESVNQYDFSLPHDFSFLYDFNFSYEFNSFRDSFDFSPPIGNPSKHIPQDVLVSSSFNFPNLISTDSSTEPNQHDSPSFSLPGVNQSVDEAPSQHFQSQTPLSLSPIGVQRLSHSPSCSPSALSDNSELDPHRCLSFSSPSSRPSSRGPWPTRSTSPSGSSHLAEDTQNQKREISSAWTMFKCSSCGESFKEPNYREHFRRCTASSSNFTCNLCGKIFKHPKSLKRHQGKPGSAPSCPVLKVRSQQTRQFECTCNEGSYTRKDSLQRHIESRNKNEGSHRHQWSRNIHNAAVKSNTKPSSP